MIVSNASSNSCRRAGSHSSRASITIVAGLFIRSYKMRFTHSVVVSLGGSVSPVSSASIFSSLYLVAIGNLTGRSDVEEDNCFKILLMISSGSARSGSDELRTQ